MLLRTLMTSRFRESKQDALLGTTTMEKWQRLHSSCAITSTPVASAMVTGAALSSSHIVSTASRDGAATGRQRQGPSRCRRFWSWIYG